MKYDRRSFLKTVGSLSLAPFLLRASPQGSDPNPEFGIQLWTLRDDMPKDPKGVLAKLSRYGYTQIESYEGPLGMWWGMSPEEFKTTLARQNLIAISSHCNVMEQIDQKADEAKRAGLSYLICPWVGPQKSLDPFKKIAEKFNRIGEICKKADIQFAYHNHDYSFLPLQGVFPQDILMQETDPELVHFQMDIYWVVTAKADPVKWLQKHPYRYPLAHIKDRIKNSHEKKASCTLGEGSIDYRAIISAASTLGMKYFIVEQERYDNTTPLNCAYRNAMYMKALLSEKKNSSR